MFCHFEVRINMACFIIILLISEQIKSLNAICVIEEFI